MNPPQHLKDPIPPKHTQPTLECDFEAYAHYLEDSDLTENEKRQILEALWNIAVAFVDIGFGVHPGQQVCGKLEDNLSKASPTAPDGLYFDTRQIIENFMSVTDPKEEKDEEGVDA